MRPSPGERERASISVEVTVRGSVPASARAYAAQKVAQVAHYSHEPVLGAHAVLEQAADPARARPALAEATLDVNGTPVRAHVAAAHMDEAVDRLQDRLRRRLVQHEDRIRTRHRWTGEATAHEWRHGDLPTERPEYFPRPAAERQVIRRKTFALEPQTPDEAAFDMELVGHDFYLFTDLATGEDALISQLPDRRYLVSGRVGALESSAAAPRVVVGGAAPLMSEQRAREHLDLAGEPFVFFVDPGTGRGRVLYRRYDGHYGLITPA
ncbi:MAG: sigma 54 modulation/S30EA ribosomal C-terminal domain-containing protein [Actinomycetes bacterium]